MNESKFMYVTYENGELKCSKCGSKNISIRSGMMCDLYTCRDCGNEMR